VTQPLHTRQWIKSKNTIHLMRFEVFTPKIQVEVFWVVTPCSVVVVHQSFRGPCCLHLQGEVTGDRKKWHRYRPGVQEDGRCH